MTMSAELCIWGIPLSVEYNMYWDKDESGPYEAIEILNVAASASQRLYIDEEASRNESLTLEEIIMDRLWGIEDKKKPEGSNSG